MIITQAIKRLEELMKEHGDVKIKFDCPFCGKTTEPEIIVAVKTYVKLDK